MKVQFKFRARVHERVRKDVIATLRREGASGVRPLFPGAEDAALARLYIADVADETLQERALAVLRRSNAVEFAEPEVKRKLIR